MTCSRAGCSYAILHVSDGRATCVAGHSTYLHAIEPHTSSAPRIRERGRVNACPSGHYYTEASTYKDPHGRRYCRICNAARSRRRRRETLN